MSITQTPVSGTAALWQYSYTPWGDVAQVIDPDGVALNYGYDAAHYLRTITDAAGNQIRYKYDLKGNRTQDYTYDPSGNLTRSVGYAYDLRNHLSQVNLAGNVTQLVSDAVGNLRSETDPNIHTTAHTPDALNRLIQTVDALNGTTGYGYDSQDRPTSVTAPNNANTQYSYDDLGNLLAETSPDRNTAAYTYDAAGNVLTLLDARHITTTYTYDAVNRVTSKTSSDSATPSYTYAYDNCGPGRLCYIYRNNVGHLIFGYDGFGRRNYELDLTVWLYSSYGFSPAGRLTQISYPNNRTVTYTYNTVGRISQVSTTQGTTTTTLASNITYSPFGPVKTFTFGNGLSYFINVDQAYRPTFQRSGYRFKNAYYDPAGNLTELDDIVGTKQTFTYDAVNELTAAADTQSGSYGSLGYIYLKNGVFQNGNRQTETRNGTMTTYSYPAGSNVLSYTDAGQYWVHDAAGNTTFMGGSGYLTYDGYGRLTAALSGAAAYGYNALDERITKTASGATTNFHYGLIEALLYESDGTTPNKVYVYVNGMPLARIDGPNIYYYHTDHLGTPQAMTDGAGATVWQAYYEPFGWATVTVGTITNNVRYPGMYADAETGLYYNWHRYYDPRVGRYITSDPVGLAGGMNTYAYVDNNPLRWTDPLGLVKIVRMYTSQPLSTAEENQLKTLETQFMKVASDYEKVLKQSCEPDRKKLLDIFDKWQVSIDPKPNDARYAQTWYSIQSSNFYGSHFTQGYGGQYRTIAHEFRHLTSENNNLQSNSDIVTPWENRPIELDAERWANQAWKARSGKECLCGK